VKVLHLSTYDTSGGAAGSAYRLHRGLLEAGIESRMLVLQKDSSDETVFEHRPDAGLSGRVRRRFSREQIRFSRLLSHYRGSDGTGSGPFSGDRSPYRLAASIEALEPDLINLHWVARLVDYRHFFRDCVGDRPVVWRLSDLNPFTGGCHYDEGCGKYRKQCGACPKLGSRHTRDWSRAIWKRKREAYEHVPDHQLHFVAQSTWIQKQVQASPLTARFESTVIPNGLDTDTYRPYDQGEARKTFNIPQEKPVVLAVADSLDDRRKGFDLLVEAVEDLDDIHLLLVGTASGELKIAGSHQHLGFVEADDHLARVYSAADVFVIPSRQDNLPNTVLEAMACGTPVVGFEAGGIPDMVRPGETGWLATEGNVQALRAAIQKAFSDDKERNQREKQARKTVEEEYMLEGQVRLYSELYEKLLERKVDG
jgi:glycosyltransferase involved in cell wall biosynthesis